MRTDPSHALQFAEIARKLDAAGFTQQVLAEMLGVSQSQVSRILSGQFKRRSKLFDDLCKIAYQSSSTPVAVVSVAVFSAVVMSVLLAIREGLRWRPTVVQRPPGSSLFPGRRVA